MPIQTRLIVAIPNSTPERLIFPYQNDTQQFDTSFYNPAFTDGRASIEEINQILAEIIAVRQPMITKLLSAQRSYTLTIVLSFLVMFGLTFFLVFSFGPLIAFPCFIIQLAFFGIISSKFRSRLIKFTTESKAGVQQVLDKYSPSFSSRGLRWVLPVHFPMWIELHKDYLLSQNSDAQPIYMPPNMYQQPAPVYTPTQGQYQDSYYQSQQQTTTDSGYNA